MSFPCSAFVMAESFVLCTLGVFVLFVLGILSSDEILTFVKRVPRLQIERQDSCLWGRLNARSRCHFRSLCRRRG